MSDYLGAAAACSAVTCYARPLGLMVAACGKHVRQMTAFDRQTGVNIVNNYDYAHLGLSRLLMVLPDN